MFGSVLSSKTHGFSNIFWEFLPFWIFLALFKFGGGLYFSILSPLGEGLFPLWLVGLFIGGVSLVQLLLDVPAGHILDKYGYLKFLKIGTLIFSFAGIGLAFGLTPATYLLGLFFSIFGGLFFSPGVSAYVLSHAPTIQAGQFISMRDIFGSLGIVFASIVLPFVLLLAPQNIGWVVSFLFFAALLMLFFSPSDHDLPRLVSSEVKLDTQHYYIKRYFLHTTLVAIKRLNPASGMLVLLNLVAQLFYGIIWFVVPLVMVHQAQTGVLSIGLGIFDFSIVILGFLLGNLADRFNKRTLVFFGLLLFAVAGSLVGLNFGWLFIIFGFLATTGDEMAGISLWSWLHTLDHEHAHDGVVAGVICLFEDLGWAIGPMVAGFAYGIIGPSWTIVLGVVPIFMVWIIYQFVAPRHSPYALSGAYVPMKPHRPRHKT